MIILNGAELPVVRFPNGETKIELAPILEHARPVNTLTLRYEDDRDLTRLMCIKGFLDDQAQGVKMNFLKILYMPYSRMDRLNDDSVFSLKYIAQFINNMNFDKVQVIEPHSDVTPALLNKCVVSHGSMELFDSVAPKLDAKYVYFPDAGAQKRYAGIKKQQLVGIKERDFATGTILNFEVFGDVLPDEPFDVIMIDDLCARGGTFFGGAAKLREMGAEKIYIVCAHCEDTVLTGTLLDGDLIEKMYTTDSILTKQHDKIEVLKITE